MGANLIAFISFIIFLSVFNAYSSDADKPNRTGQTYPILEKDGITELEERAANIDINKYFNKEDMGKKIKEFKPKDLAHLPAGKKDRKFSVDMTYTLEFDIPDGKGGILYPKGFAFNPLDYITFTTTIAVINGDDDAEIEWLKGSPYYKYKNADVKILITDGSWSDVSEKLQRPVYYLTRNIKDRFKLAHTPSVIVKNGAVMEVAEFYVEQKPRP